MRRFNPVKFIIMIIAILATVSIIRFIPFAPVILIIVTVSMVRSSKNRESKEDSCRDRKEETYQSRETEQMGKQYSGSAIITCDYCGSRVDTDKYNVCNHCGGPYYDDEEWKKIRYRKNL